MPETILNAKQLNIVQLTQELENPTAGRDGLPLKLIIENNVLTVKAGSKISIPAGKESGTNVFTTITTDSDLSLTVPANTWGADQVVCYSNGALFCTAVTNIHSKTYSSGIYNALLYNTTDNLISLRENNVETQTNVSFPLCFIKLAKEAGASEYTAKSIIKRFDYVGYMGKVVFVNPGFSVIIPNGYNADGSVNNINYITESVLTVNPSTLNTTYELALKLDSNVASLDLISLTSYYDGTVTSPYYIRNNVVYKGSTIVLACPFITFYVTTSGAIYNFHIFSPIKLDMPYAHKTLKFYFSSAYSTIALGDFVVDKVADIDFAVYKNGQRLWSGNNDYGLENDYYMDNYGRTISFGDSLPEGTQITIEVF